MSWETRLLQRGAYTAPSGGRAEFDYEDLSRSTSLRRAVFEFAGVDGAYVQTNGRGPSEFALRCYFVGDDCDELADAFEALCGEDGAGRLEHPLYGSFDAVPTGDLRRDDRVVTAANQATVDVTFVRTLPTLYPVSSDSPRGRIEGAWNVLAEAVGLEFGERAVLATEAERQLAGVAVADSAQATSAAFAGLPRDAAQSVADAMDALVGGGAELLVNASEFADSLFVALEIAATSTAEIAALLGLASGLVARLIDIPENVPSSYAGDAGTIAVWQLAEATNRFSVADAFAAGAVAVMARAAASAEYRSREDALVASALVVEQRDAWNAWREEAAAVLGVLDTGAVYAALYTTVTTAAQQLLGSSFGLPVRRVLVVDRSRTVLDLASELYADVESAIDDVIRDNALTGAQMLVVEAGTEIVYYA